MTKKTAKPSAAAAPVEKRAPSVEAEDRLLKIGEVKDLVGLGKTMIYRKVKDGTFPQPCKPGGAATRWSEREVRAWRDEVLAARAA
jgi:prophage regulatory protein